MLLNINTWTYNQLYVEKCHSENCMVKTVWGKLHGDKIQGERFSVGKTVWGKLTMGITVKVKTVG